ncbi:MAG: FkbM family methyltransferase [Gammaproteobacteria bacterium]|nr:FkbM family methyltransferase [Gammaproteobacteria bacterium]
MPGDYDISHFKGGVRQVTLKLPPGTSLREDRRITVYAEGELISDTLAAEGSWEPFETAIFLQRLKGLASSLETKARHSQSASPPLYVLDIGANIGYYSLLAASACGARVMAFEPSASNFALLQHNLRGLDYVETFQVALSEARGAAGLQHWPGNAGDRRLLPHARIKGVALSGPDEMVEMVSGDEVIHETVHFIKIDTQGAELQVLKGLRKTLKANLSHLEMIVEFWPMGIKRQGGDYRELVALIDSLGKQIKVMDQTQQRLVSVSSADLTEFSVLQMKHHQDGFLNLLLT